MSRPREEAGRIAAESGFRPEFVEKVLWLMDLLDNLMRHPFLEGKLALKGGTALNLFCYPLPRLSVDIDLNYVGSADREAMLAEKPQIEKAVEGVCQRLGLSLRRQPAEHAGGKWSLQYPSGITPRGNLEVDLNWLLRVPLWATSRQSSVLLGDRGCANVVVLDVHELAAGKLAALFSRSAPRDVFDAARLLADPRIDGEKLRLGFVVYGAMSRRDWREIAPEDIACDDDQFRGEVGVLMRSGEGTKTAAEETVALCRTLAEKHLLPLRDHEREFLRLINEQGTIQPRLLTADPDMQAIIQSHPALMWKALNVAKHQGKL